MPPCNLFCSFILTFALCHGAFERKSCGFLYSQNNFKGDTFNIEEGSNFANLEETYFSTNQIWNVTISFKIQEGYLLTACNERYFHGRRCKEFTQNYPILPEGFEIVFSANCICAANCRCTDVDMKRSCARGYLSKGCNTCNAFYVDLKGSKYFIADDFKDKISSIIVRKGCTLTVYDEEDHAGESLILKGVIKETTSDVKYQAPTQSIEPAQDGERTGNEYQQCQIHFSLLLQEMIEQNRRCDEKINQIMTLMQGNTNKQMEICDNQKQDDLKRQMALANVQQQEALVKQQQQELVKQKQQEALAKLQQQQQEVLAILQQQQEVTKLQQQEELANLQRQEELDREMLETEIARIQNMTNHIKITFKGNGSCLRKGTKILAEYGQEKPVETLQIGDVILDGNLKPTQVLGVTAWFLSEQNFFGFEKGNYFFTETHLLVGRDNSTDETQLYVVSTEKLLDINPLMEYLSILDMKGEFDILKYKEDQKETQLEKVSLLKDPLIHPQDTLVYFLQVDNPEGTYIANGYVCRHEFPPVEYWPKTIALLYSIYDYPEAKKIAQLKYTIESIDVITQIIDDIYYKMEGVLRKTVFEEGEDTEILLEDFESKKVIKEIFRSPSFATFAVGLYSRTANTLADRVDLDLTYNGKVGTLQKLLWEAAVQEIRHHINSSEFKHLLEM